MEEIKRLYSEGAKPRDQIGKLLSDKKDELRYGRFGKWLKANFPEAMRRTLGRYLAAYRESHNLDKVSKSSKGKAKDTGKKSKTLTPENFKEKLKVKVALWRSEYQIGLKEVADAVEALLDELLAELDQSESEPLEATGFVSGVN